jgi:hypothetical protein
MAKYHLSPSGPAGVAPSFLTSESTFQHEPHRYVYRLFTAWQS